MLAKPAPVMVGADRMAMAPRGDARMAMNRRGLVALVIADAAMTRV